MNMNMNGHIWLFFFERNDSSSMGNILFWEGLHSVSYLSKSVVSYNGADLLQYSLQPNDMLRLIPLK
jgi:hypothetical protein